MKRSVFFALVAITVLALVLALFLSQPDTVDSARDQSQPLVPGLKDRVNEVDRLDIRTAPENTIRLVRSAERWRVENAENYEADFEQVHQLLRDLAAGSRAEERTSNPEWHERLGVAEARSADDAAESSFEVAFPGTELPALIIGRAGPAGQSRFVRQLDDNQVWLSDREINVPAEMVDWLQRSIMDIPGSELSEIALRHADGELVQLEAADESSSQWVLMNVPEGREAAPAWQLSSTANALSSLRLDDVRQHEGAPDDASAALFVTRDGLNFVATLFEDEDGTWVHFSVSAEVDASAEGETLSDDAASASADAAAVDARLSPWDFRLPSAKYEQMTRRMEDFLAESETTAEE